jgi:hypothetical protein
MAPWVAIRVAMLVLRQNRRFPNDAGAWIVVVAPSFTMKSNSPSSRSAVTLSKLPCAARSPIS